MPQITMLENVWNGATLLASGSAVTVSTELADGLVGAGKAVDSSGYRGARVDQTMANDIQPARASSVVGAGNIVFPRQQYYRLATFGDSRCNVSFIHTGATASGNNMNVDRVAAQLCRVRGDMRIIFNGGVSGDSASNWNAARGSSQTVQDVLTANPDVVIMQYGINDVIAWNGSSPTQQGMVDQIAGNLMAACAAFMGAGVFVIFESMNTCAASSITYINGYGSSGGFGANAAEKAAIMQAVNLQMQSWISSWPDRAVYVDTSSIFSGSDGYAVTDGSYYDGTHPSAYGSLRAALLVDAAISVRLPRRTPIMPSTGRNGVDGYWLSPTNGLGSNIAITADTGTWATETYSISADEQIINFNCTALSGGVARRIVDITPFIIGAGATVPVSAGDILQGRVEYAVDDGNGGAPATYAISLRPRIYYDDATNEFVAFGQGITNSTDFPRMPAHRGHLLTPGLAVKATKASANILTTTRFQILLYGNQTGVTRLKLRAPELRKLT